MRFTAALATTAAVVAVAPAGVYHPLEPTPFPVADGKAADLGFGSRFDGQFPVLFTRWGNVATETDNPDRKAVLARLATEASDPAAAGADLLRLNRAAEAVNRLMPLSRGRSPDGRVLFNLAHAHAVRGEWGEALSLHELAAEDGVPADLAGATADQRKWLTRVEREHYRRWLVEHRRRAAAKSDPAAEEVFPLFPKDKPADAAAVVQQLLLWAPWDTALYWLLAEVYAEQGRVREAATILDRIVESRQYSNRAKLMARRAELTAAVARLPPEKEDEPLLGAPPPPPEDSGKFLPSTSAVLVAAGAFAALAVVMGGLQVRRWLRRPRRPAPAP